MLVEVSLTRMPFQSTPSTRRETGLWHKHFGIPEHFNPLPPHGGRQRRMQAGRIASIFQSTPSTRRETIKSENSKYSSSFQSTPSTRRETHSQLSQADNQRISIHSLHTEGDRNGPGCTHAKNTFQSTPSTRRETFPKRDALCCYTFQSTPSTRRETKRWLGRTVDSVISIHSLHTEGDVVLNGVRYSAEDFNPLPPHGGRLGEYVHTTTLPLHFNPLPPHGGRPDALGMSYGHYMDFNPLPPHGGRQHLESTGEVTRYISIHSLHTEGDARSSQGRPNSIRFQSTPSTRRETARSFALTTTVSHFNPLPPHGGRRNLQWTETELRSISIHSLHTEGDVHYITSTP